MILAAVSPVFERMLFGDFKEGNSRIAELPVDSYKVVKLLVDLVYNGSCKPDSLDDILPLSEVMDRYQMKKGAFYHMCGEVVLGQLNCSNYHTLLPKFVSVLDKDNIKKAADKVMCYTSSNFIDKFDKTRNLPEEVLLVLLQRNDIQNPELDIFYFLTKWYDFQTKELKRTLNLTSQLFQCIRYFLISPHLLHTKVALCPLVDKHVLTECNDHLYHKLLNVDESNCKCGECIPPNNAGRFRQSINIFAYCNPSAAGNQGWSYYPDGKYGINFNGNVGSTTFTQSQSLKNGTYVFSLLNLYNTNSFDSLRLASLSLCASDKNRIQRLYIPIHMKDSITLLVYGNDICFKITNGARAVSIYSATGIGPFTVDLIGISNSKYSGTLEVCVG